MPHHLHPNLIPPSPLTARVAAMGLPRLNSCLCCTLPSGVLAIGITCLVLHSLGVLFSGGILASPDFPDLFRETIRNDTSLFEDGQPVEEKVEEILHEFRVLFGVLLATAVVRALADIALLVASCKSWPRPMLVWVIVYSLATPVNIGYGLYMEASDTSPDLWFIVCLLGAGVVFIYLIMVVFSYYKVLQERENGGAYTLHQMRQGP